MTTVLSTFSTPLKPGDMITIDSIYCYENEQNISQCRYSFNTKATGCDLRYSLGLECMCK